VGQVPERNHAGEVERDDCRGDAEGLADHHLVDAAGDVFEVVALHHHGDATSYLNVFNRPAHLSFGFGEGLAIFLRDDAGDVVDVIFEQHLQLKQRLDAVFRGRAAPLGKSGGGGFDGLVDFSGIGERDLGQRFSRGGIDYIAPFYRGRFGPLSIDGVREFYGGGGAYSGHWFTSTYREERGRS